MTLVFLGHLEQAAVPRIAELLGDAAGPSCRLTATGVKPLPARRPRIFALDLEDEDGRASRLQDRLTRRLAAEGLYTPEKRAFWPHVTLARAKGRAVVGRWEGAPPPDQPFDVDELVLYRSRPGPAGARYEALSRVRLGG